MSQQQLKHVLVIGNGGREHALAWKLAQSKKVGSVHVCPGNGGTQYGDTKISNIALETAQIVPFVKEKNVSLVVVGPEQPLVEGLVDHCKVHGVPCFGPSKRASILEASKAFSKAFMKRHNIPTSRYHTFSDFETALQHLKEVDYPVVLKASGLAAGKGVIIPGSKEEAISELRNLMINKPFGSASDEVVIEERLEGPEVSVLAFTDGYTVSLMPAAQDHKRIHDNDEGANTGGMGAYAPAPIATPQFMDQVLKRVLKPTVDGMRKEGIPYVGVIYAGILVDKKSGMNVLEFNCRFGDPETQVILPLLESDLVDVLEACVEGRLDSIDIKWKTGVSAVTVVAASKGYPSSYETGKKITGLATVTHDTSFVFHAGTKSQSLHDVVTSGGRVLAVTSWANSIQQATETSYTILKNIHFDGIYYRKDIAKKAVEYKEASSSYKDSGVDIDIADNLVDSIAPLAKQTARSGTDAALGGFGGLFDVKAAGYKDPILVSGTDGVGTKLLIAQQANIHGTIGQDLVAMSVNDILVQGAEPLFFLDYFATGKLSVESAKEVIAGIARACKESNCALIGGETAEMPGMYPPGKYDLAGFAVGAVERDQVLPKTLIHGDVIIGVSSSGVHSNGFSLVRYVVEKANASYDQPAPWDPSKTVAQALLTPTKLYIKSCLPLIKSGKVKAMAHITGGGLTENVPRVLGQGDTAEIDLSAWNLPPVFKWLAQQGNIARDELIRTFNCGIGMVIIVDKENVDECLASLEKSGEQSYRIGSIVQKEAHQVVYKNNWSNWEIRS